MKLAIKPVAVSRATPEKNECDGGPQRPGGDQAIRTEHGS